MSANTAVAASMKNEGHVIFDGLVMAAIGRWVLDAGRWR
jgi:hypothetical protein